MAVENIPESIEIHICEYSFHTTVGKAIVDKFGKYIARFRTVYALCPTTDRKASDKAIHSQKYTACNSQAATDTVRKF